MSKSALILSSIILILSWFCPLHGYAGSETCSHLLGSNKVMLSSTMKAMNDFDIIVPMSIFPNPIAGGATLTVEVGSVYSSYKTIRLQIISSLGVVVKDETFSPSPRGKEGYKYTTVLDEMSAPGMYTVWLINPNDGSKDAIKEKLVIAQK